MQDREGIFFRFLKHLLGCRHLYFHSQNGIELQVYCAIIVCLKCGKQDLNLHGVNPHQALNLARLPIPPFPQAMFCCAAYQGIEGPINTTQTVCKF